MRLVIPWVVFMVLNAAAAAGQMGSWQDSTSAPVALPNTPSPLMYQGAGVSNGRIYMFGGYDPSFAVTGETIEYDPVANSWTRLGARPLPLRLAQMGYASLNDRIYCIGGATQGGVPQRSIHVFDPATGWSTLGSGMLMARSNLTCVVHAGKIYAIGGMANNTSWDGKAMEEFDSATGTWRGPQQGLPALPEPRFSFAVASLRGRIIVAGGNAGVGMPIKNNVYGWDPTNAAAGWVTLEAMPGNGKSGGFGASFGGRFFCIGGEGTTGGTRSALMFDPQEASGNQWASLTSANFPYTNGAGAVLDSRIHVVGVYGAPWQGSREFQAFAPPANGNPPAVPSGFSMVDNLDRPIAPGAWMNGTSIRFTAEIMDPDAVNGVPNLVALEVEVRRVGDPFVRANCTSAMGIQGNATATYGPLSEGDYKVRYRAVDDYENSSAWVEAAVPAFRCDLTAPPVPSALSPLPNEDVAVYTRVGPVTFRGSEVSDDRGAAVTYEFQVCNSGGALISQAESEVPEMTFTLLTKALPYTWRVRARDAAGNISAWTPVSPFRAVFIDTLDHGAGDAGKVCGFSAATSGAAGGLGALLTLMMLMMLMTGRRSR